MAKSTYTDPMVKQDWEERLPTRAQDMIDRLRRRVEVEIEMAEEARLSNGPVESDVHLERGGGKRQDVPLPLNSRVRFYVGDRDTVDHVTVHVAENIVDRQRRKVVQVMGGGQILVKPLSGNLVHIVVED